MSSSVTDQVQSQAEVDSDSEEELGKARQGFLAQPGTQTVRGEMDYASSRLSGKLVEQRQGKPQRKWLLTAHWSFKVLAAVLYLLANVMGMGYITTFVFVVLLLSIDFWLVKNLSGRLLAGLRWWSVTDHGTGKMAWRFEAWTPEEREVAYHSQVKLFWAGLLAQQALWAILLLSAVFSFKLGWLIIAFIASTLNGANLYGYVRCRLQQPGNSREDQPGVFRRLGEGMTTLFRTAGGVYTRGRAQQGQQADYAGIGGGAAP